MKKAPGHGKSNVSSKNNKLKNTKLALKAWDKQSFGKAGDRVRICRNKVNEILFKQDLIQSKWIPSMLSLLMKKKRAEIEIVFGPRPGGRFCPAKVSSPMATIDKAW